MTDQSGIAPLALPRDAVTQLRDVLDQLLRTCTCDHGPARHDVDGSCQSCNCPAAGYCPHCGSGDAGPTAEARLDAALRQILADANHHDLCATESKTPEGGISHSSIAAGLRIAARHLLAAQKETPDA